MPKKLFVYGAHVHDELEDAAGYGWQVPLDDVSFDWPKLVANKNAEIERLNGIYGRLLENAGVTIIEGTASLSDANTVVVGDTSYRAKHITIATGSWPVIPDVPGKECILTSNEMFYLPQLPKQAVLCQGDAQLSELTTRFVNEPATSLFGTLSLWQGVDVPGPSLSLVIIDRIPFPRPDDPLLTARQRAVDARGGNGFLSVAANHAALLLAQGAGRLLLARDGHELLERGYYVAPRGRGPGRSRQRWRRGDRDRKRRARP